MIESGADGHAVYDTTSPGSTLESPQPKLCSVRTPDGRILISCAYCRSGETVLEITPNSDGFARILQNERLMGTPGWLQGRPLPSQRSLGGQVAP